jgi:hypothetical protein
MPIHQNNTRVSIDFQYEYQLPDDHIIQYNMKFSHTPSGPIVSIAQEGYAEAIELPADMFYEVFNFLNTQGMFRNKIPVIGSAPPSRPTNIPTINKKDNKLPTVTGHVAAPLQNITQENPIVSLPQDNETIEIDPEEAANIAKHRAEAKAKANIEKSKMRPTHKR